MDKRFLKEDGSLDIGGINNLPLEDFMDAMGDLTQEQYDEYLSKIPLNESKGLTHIIVVDYPMDDVRAGVDADIALNELRSKNNLKK